MQQDCVCFEIRKHSNIFNSDANNAISIPTFSTPIAISKFQNFDEILRNYKKLRNFFKDLLVEKTNSLVISSQTEVV